MICFSGIFIQIWLTYGGTYHEEQFPPLRRQKKHESREERKQRKYRYLYQVDIFKLLVANVVSTLKSSNFQKNICHLTSDTIKRIVKTT